MRVGMCACVPRILELCLDVNLRLGNQRDSVVNFQKDIGGGWRLGAKTIWDTSLWKMMVDLGRFNLFENFLVTLPGQVI